MREALSMHNLIYSSEQFLKVYMLLVDPFIDEK